MEPAHWVLPGTGDAVTLGLKPGPSGADGDTTCHLGTVRLGGPVFAHVGPRDPIGPEPEASATDRQMLSTSSRETPEPGTYCV